MKSLNSFFDEIYCVNLNKDTGRLHRMRKISSNFNFEFTRVPAVSFHGDVLLMEDDILPNKDYEELIRDFYFPENFKFVYLGGNRDGRYSSLRKFDETFDRSDNIAFRYPY